MGSLGPLEIVLIFLVILLIFGAKRIPEIARGLGKGIREFKSATSEISRELTIEDTPHRIQQPRQGTPVSYTQPAQQAQAPPPQQAPPAQPDNTEATQVPPPPQAS
ncbi:MAG: twin-arginine translocase TatA/TatE family subunit [Rhodothermales bacterium]